MTTRREDFPSLSIGRSQGANVGAHLQRTSSHETLSTHPLLSPTPTSAFASSSSSSSSLLDPSSPTTPTHPQPPPQHTSPTGPRYVPYTPRQRVAPTSATVTGATMHAPSPQHAGVGGGATGRLQVMNLKAAAQGIGLDMGSVGWGMLERLMGLGLGLGEEGEGEWGEIWSAVTTGKATLLLPLEQPSPHDTLTPEFMKDHIILTDGSSRTNAPIITLSGLRGTLSDETLTLISTLPTTSKPFESLTNPSTRQATLSSLPPLPSVPTTTASPMSPTHSHSHSHSHSHPYPTYTLPTYTPSLPLPPRPPPTVSKPPLPPRPGARISSASPSSTTTVVPIPSAPTPAPIPTPTPSAASRLVNPFASLFGKSPLSSSPPVTAPISASPSPAPSVLPATSSPLVVSTTLPSTSTTEKDATSPTTANGNNNTDHAVEIAAYTISHQIVRKELAKSLTKAIKSEIESRLAEVQAPSWVVARVLAFAEPLFPLIKTPPPNLPAQPKKRTLADLGKPSSSAAAQQHASWVVNGFESVGSGEEVVEKFQALFGEVEDGLFGHGHGHGKGEEKDGASPGEDEKDDKEREKEKGGMGEEKIRDVMNAVESVLCEVFYDRLFRQPTSDDASHDEALSSRIAALNMLDLGLEHLGVDVGEKEEGKAGVREVVKLCGETLSQLELPTCHSPADKAAVLVAAHKVVVDGLSKLPPIRLKSDAEIEEQKNPLSASFTKSDTDEPKDALISAPSTFATDASPPMVSSPEIIPILNLPPEHDEHHLTEANGAAHDPSPASSTYHSPSVSPRLHLSPALSHSELKPTSSTSKPTPVNGDILLPLIIYAVVKANPPRLVSHLLYTQRFRNQSVGGEEGYCLINLMAVAEFLENVDLGALGLGEDEKKVLSTADLSPIPLSRTALGTETPKSIVSNASHQTAASFFRGRVEQQVDAIAGSANKMLSGVVDTSFGVLRAFLPVSSDQVPAPPPTTAGEAQPESTPWNARPGFGLLRRESGFSIASLAASLPGRERARSTASQYPAEEKGQQMVEVSRPASVRSTYRNESDEESGPSVSSETDEEEGEGEEDDGEEGEEEEEAVDETKVDARSIRSFESMMSGARKKNVKGRGLRAGAGRKSIADRLAQVPGLSRFGHSTAGSVPQDLPHHHKGSPPPSRRSSLLPPGPSSLTNRFDSPVPSRSASPAPFASAPITLRIAPPKQRFLECTEDDLRVSEVGELLREYKRLVEGVRALGVFDEP
ncbi:hypothetical protein JAAARDRAFT_42332 [Jaapia argillacea MUCL 33604]|uniref:VPS9 domain-containing protein n=1 Tax=Jaapia argillacea MUCL 33604 TaxID=933084 RepID=A0A067P5G3_9AGAM|nr:hypothetical protein JAAARDRAFT_42332 [Jaapia argillacea MUCL 33604]